jgi:hypothetical protein
MSPLKFFLQIVDSLDAKPLSFWDEESRQKMLQDLKLAISKLKTSLEGDNLTGTNTYLLLCRIDEIVNDKVFAETLFVQGLSNLLEVYKLSSSNKKQKEIINSLGEKLISAKSKILEYYVALENLERKAKEMTSSDVQKSDRKVLEEVGIFYILEYTTYVFYKLSQLGEKGKRKLFYDGLKTREANLPPYTDFAESFRKDLCLKIIDGELRNNLLVSFFKFERIFRNDDLEKICFGFKDFNLELLRIFEKWGIERFKAVFLSPFGKDLPMSELIAKIEQIES